jgi:SAM-dependent methyltransferase
MRECSKSIQRRLSDSNFIRYYFVGDGLDIGGKPDPLAIYEEFFPLILSVKTWDWEDGDGQILESVKDNSFDFIHSSHCLEHLVDPREGLRNWLRVIKSGGHLVITVPDEDLYEQGKFPSSFNRDHRWTFTIYKTFSWSSNSINILDLVRELGFAVELIKVEQLYNSYRYNLPRYDQTITPIAECGIEFILRKRTNEEIALGTSRLRSQFQPDRNMRLLLNQYKDDIHTLKSRNKEKPPFNNDQDL